MMNRLTSIRILTAALTVVGASALTDAQAQIVSVTPYTPIYQGISEATATIQASAGTAYGYVMQINLDAPGIGFTTTPLTAGGSPGGSVVVSLRRQILDDLWVVLGHADLGRATGRSELDEEIGVDLGVLAPLFGHIVFVVDRLDRADRLAGTAVDAFVGVYVQHPSALVNAVDRTFLDTGLVLEIDAGFGDRVRHEGLLTVSSWLFG